MSVADNAKIIVQPLPCRKSLLTRWLTRKLKSNFKASSQRPKSIVLGDEVVACLRGITFKLPNHPGLGRSPPYPYFAQLPSKILSDIFMIYCLPSRWNADSKIPPAPMLLSHVCKQWRRHILSLPILWSRFSPDVWQAYTENPAPIRLVQLWLERSWGYPISLKLGPHRTFPIATRLLFANIEQWGSLDVVLGDDIAKELVKAPLESATSLQSLDVTTYELNQVLHDEWAAGLRRFPTLRRFTWSSRNSPDHLFPNIPWSSLTYIELSVQLSMQECVMFLGTCTQARHIGIGNIAPAVDDLQVFPTTLPHLAYLRVQLYSDSVGTLLQHFTLPSLRTLRFNTLFPSTTPRTYGVVDFILRSSCTLQALHIFDIDLHEDDIVYFLSLSCLRSLQELKITSQYISQRTISYLVYPKAPGAGGILPHLVWLHLESVTAPVDILRDMVNSRWRSFRDTDLPASLQQICLILCSLRPNRSHSSPLTIISAEGLSIGKFTQMRSESAPSAFNF